MSKFAKIYPLVASLLPLVVLAQVTGRTDTLGPVLEQALKNAKTLVTLVFVFALVVLGWGIVKFIASAGNEEKLKKAKTILTWGVIGIVVLASVFGIIQFIQSYFGVGGPGSIDVPGVKPPLL